jgi:hypothetical protein
MGLHLSLTAPAELQRLAARMNPPECLPPRISMLRQQCYLLARHGSRVTATAP